MDCDYPTSCFPDCYVIVSVMYPSTKSIRKVLFMKFNINISVSIDEAKEEAAPKRNSIFDILEDIVSDVFSVQNTKNVQSNKQCDEQCDYCLNDWDDVDQMVDELYDSYDLGQTSASISFDPNTGELILRLEDEPEEDAVKEDSDEDSVKEDSPSAYSYKYSKGENKDTVAGNRSGQKNTSTDKQDSQDDSQGEPHDVSIFDALISPLEEIIGEWNDAWDNALKQNTKNDEDEEFKRTNRERRAGRETRRDEESRGAYRSRRADNLRKKRPASRPVSDENFNKVFRSFTEEYIDEYKNRHKKK